MQITNFASVPSLDRTQFCPIASMSAVLVYGWVTSTEWPANWSLAHIAVGTYWGRRPPGAVGCIHLPAPL